MPQLQQHTELADIINEIPASLADDAGDAGDGGAGDDDDVVTDDLDAGDAGDAGDDDDAGTGDDDGDTDVDPTVGSDAGDDNDDYITSGGDDDDDTTPVTSTPPAGAPAAAATDEGTFILQGLTKIPVRIVGADDVVKTVEVYGFGDLPRDMKGFATPYEQGVFQAAVTSQELKARDLQNTFRTQQSQTQAESFQRAENKAIQEDLTALRKDGIFPKFKGTPGTKEFNESEGAKEFDRVIAFMNDKNDQYLKANQEGKAYRHIGFAEAYAMLHGPDPRSKEKAENSARRTVAGKLKTSRGTGTDTRKPATTRVTNITDLQGEFEALTAAN